MSNFLIKNSVFQKVHSGGSKGVRPRPPPGTKLFLISCSFGKICMLAPSLEGWRPLLRGILDPPLHISSYPDVLALKTFDGRKFNFISYITNFKSSSLQIIYAKKMV